jgi:outer membrane protein assembly factor BamB
MFKRIPVRTSTCRQNTVKALSPPSLAAPAIGADGSVLQPVSDDSSLALVALDPATGAVRWQSSEGGDARMSPLVDGEGWNYYASPPDALAGRSTLHAHDGAGRFQWRLALPTAINRSLALGGNGVLYLCGTDNKLYAVGP